MTKEKLINLYNKIISTNPLLWEDPYQKEILTNPEFFTSNKPQVIAGAVGFGKTPVAIISSEMEIAMNPKIKILTIPYSTKVLRSNYYECYEELFPGHSCIIETQEDLENWYKGDCNVGIALPVMLVNAVDENIKVDTLVIDEAQAWYFAEQTQKRGNDATIATIIDITKPNRQVLLTGSPYKFNAKKDNYDIFYVSTEQMRKIKRVSDLKIEVAQTSVNIKPNDYTKRFGPVKEEILDVKTNRRIIRELCKEIVKKVKLPFYSKEWYQINRLTDRAFHVLGKMGKTIIFCGSVDQADDWYEILKSSGQINQNRILLSHSKNDKDSENFDLFKKGEADILIAVDRGQLGYNDTELVNVIDATFSWNPMLVQQMMGRAMRPNSDIPKKYFIKLAAAGMGYHVTNFMTCVLSLTRYEIYSTFTGKMGKLPVLIPTIKTQSKRKNKNNNETTKLHFYNDFLDVHLDIDLWTNFNTKANETFADFTAIELDDFLSSMLGMKRPNNYWQDLGKEGCHQEALKYKKHEDFSNCSGGCAQASREMGWYKEITSHMKTKRSRSWYKDKEQNREVALQHPTRSLWANGRNGAQSAYEWARKQKNEDGTTWVEEFFPEPLKTGIKTGFKYSEETKIKMRKPKKSNNNFKLNKQ